MAYLSQAEAARLIVFAHRTERIQNSPLSGICKGTLSALTRFANAEGKCRPSQATIARLAGFTKRPIRYALAELEALKIIRTVPGRGMKHTTEYVIDFWAIPHQGEDMAAATTSKRRRKVATATTSKARDMAAATTFTPEDVAAKATEISTDLAMYRDPALSEDLEQDQNLPASPAFSHTARTDEPPAAPLKCDRQLIHMASLVIAEVAADHITPDVIGYDVELKTRLKQRCADLGGKLHNSRVIESALNAALYSAKKKEAAEQTERRAKFGYARRA